MSFHKTKINWGIPEGSKHQASLDPHMRWLRTLTGVYVGPEEKLKGKRAMLQPVPATAGGGFKAQFDDRTTGRGYGWWAYKDEDFILEGIDDGQETKGSEDNGRVRKRGDAH